MVMSKRQKTVSEPGLSKALDAIERKCKADGQLAVAKEWAAKLAAGNAVTIRERADLFAKDIRARVQYRANVAGEEGPSFASALFLGYGDADDIAAAIGTLCEASGIETRIVPEEVGHGWTCHLEVKLENGEWYRP